MSSMIGTSARPFSVSAYSTRGGTSGNVRRSTIPSSSSARRRSESVRGLMPGERALELAEARAAVGEVADDQQRPLAADDLGGPADGTGVIRQPCTPDGSARLSKLKWIAERRAERRRSPTAAPPDSRRSPSDGCTSTQPWPWKATWNVSPEPRPMRFLRLTSVLIDVVTPEDHMIAACASANVGAAPTSSRTGGPSVSERDPAGARQRHVRVARPPSRSWRP